jgi:hypothetical protein
VFLSTLDAIRTGGDPAGTGDDKPTAEDLQIHASLDWEPGIRVANEWYDRFAKALRPTTRAARLAVRGKHGQDLDLLLKEAKRSEERLKQGDPNLNASKEVSKNIACISIGLVAATIQHPIDAWDGCEQIQANLQVAFALVAFQRDNGHYPAKLDEIAPKYLVTIPGDVFSNKALIYKPSDKGFLVYSVGINGKDDGGLGYDDIPPGDDLHVRLPLPELTKSP